MKIAALTLAAILLLVALVLVGAGYRWRSGTRAAVAALEAGAVAPTPARFDTTQLAGLPAPVRRYLLAVLPTGQPLARTVHLTQEGEFLTRPDVNGWGPFTATQDVSVKPAGFVWDARISMMAGIAVRVRDGFTGGRGAMHGAALGLVTVVHQEGTGEIAVASLMRYLAEACWFPTALLPASGVVWAPVDDSTARATLTVGGASASVDFHFGGDGLVSRVSAMRPRAVGAGSVPTPWQGRWTEYGVLAGAKIPVAGEVEWQLPEGPQPYWRGRITAVEYR